MALGSTPEFAARCLLSLTQAFGRKVGASPQIVKRYKTDNRLWLRLAAVFFVIIWFLPIQGTKHEQIPPAGFFLILANAVTSSDASWSTVISVAGALVIWTFVIGLAALTAAWLTQCILQIVRAR